MTDDIKRLPPYLRDGAIVLLDGRRKKVETLMWHQPQGYYNGKPNALLIIFEGDERVTDINRIKPIRGSLPDGFSVGSKIEYRGEQAEIKSYYFRRFKEDVRDQLIVKLEIQDRKKEYLKITAEVLYRADDFRFPNSYKEMVLRNEEKIERALETAPKPIIKRRNPKPGR